MKPSSLASAANLAYMSVHLVVLTSSSGLQVLSSGANALLLSSQLEPDLGMLLLVAGSLFEDGWAI